MNSQKTTVIPFPAPSKNGLRYSAETEKRNNVIGTRLSEELKNRKLSKKEFCTTLKDYGVDVSQSALGKWTNGLTVPNAYQLLAICYALDLEDGLAAFTGEHTPLLNEVGAEKVRAYREDLIATGKYNPMPTPTNTIRYIDKPVSNLRVSAGTGSFLDEDNFEMVSFPENAVPAEADFGVRVSGNSMEPVYHDGQIVWVERCETLSIGQVGRYIAYLRQLKKRKTPLICQLSHDCNRVHQIPAFQHFNFQSFLQHTPNDPKSSFRADDPIRIVFVIRNQNRLHVEPSVAVRKCVTVALVRLPLPIGFQIAFTVIDEHTDLAY